MAVCGGEMNNRLPNLDVRCLYDGFDLSKVQTYQHISIHFCEEVMTTISAITHHEFLKSK